MAADHGYPTDPQESATVEESVTALAEENKLLRRRLDRETRIRRKAEEIAEQGLRDLYHKQRELEFLSQITKMANQAGSAREVLASALEYICRFIEWPAAHAHIVGGERLARRMWPSNIWYADPALDVASLQTATAEYVFTKGEGLPGQVWDSAGPVWLDDLKDRSNFPRSESALAAGMRSAFAVPLLIGSEVAAALEFFGPNPTPEDPALLDMLGKAGTQLGRVIERDHANARLLDPMHDALTGLPSRRFFLRNVEQAIREHALDHQRGFCVLFINLDQFKLVNDSLGHAAGDVLLQQVGARLKASLEEGDLAGTAREESLPQLISRLGGDEFAMLLPDIPDAKDALAVADRIHRLLCNPFRVEGHEVVIEASIGIAMSSSENRSADEMVRHADLAMHRAKARGTARSEIFEGSLQDFATRRMTLHNELRAAVNNETFELHYQPVVSLADGEILGVEALVRWRTSPTTLRYPDEFIFAAEETGLIVPLGAWVLREACQAASRWSALRNDKPPVTVAVNVSPRQFAQPDLVDRVRAIIVETGIRPELLTLEVTESMTMGDADRAAAVLNQLRDLGVRISIDDFGTGFSCLSYLHRLPLQVLKIDRSFIARMETHMESLEIVNTILVLARSLGLKVVAEGAETAEEVHRLRSLGCDSYQGFYFSPPVTEEQLLELLDASAESRPPLPTPPPD